jgi:hypothetical protein
LVQERVGEVIAGHPDARVHGYDAVRADDDRVEVKLGDLGQVAGEPGDAKEGVAQRLGVVQLAAERGEAGDPMPSRENCSSSAPPTPPDWTITPMRPGAGC